MLAARAGSRVWPSVERASCWIWLTVWFNVCRAVAGSSFFCDSQFRADSDVVFHHFVAINAPCSRSCDQSPFAAFARIGPITATGYIRHGIGGYLTLGIGGQYAAGDWQLDAETVLGTPIGLFRAQGSVSDVADKKGFAASLDWIETFTTGKSTWSFTILSSMFSRDFASPFDRTGRINDQRWRIDARADWRQGSPRCATWSWRLRRYHEPPRAFRSRQ